jgi:hypothetical protein
MADYRAMYLELFNRITDAIEALLEVSRELAETQRKTEYMYIESGDEDDENEK